MSEQRGWDGIERRSPARLHKDLELAQANVARHQAQEHLEALHGRRLAWPGFTRTAAQARRQRLVLAAAIVVLALALVLLGRSVLVPSERSQADGAAPAQHQARLYVLVNLARVDAGLAPLDRDSALEAEALAWSQTMANDKQLRHRPNLRQGAPANAGTMAENVAYNPSVEDAHQRLMASPGHRANILNPRLSHVGIGVAHDDAGHLWITQVFMEAKSVSAPPAPAAPTAPSSAARPAGAPPTTCRCGP